MTSVGTLPKSTPARVLACGAYLKNTACLIQGRRVVWSEPHGDLTGAVNREALEASVDDLLEQASGPIDAVAHDLHPDFHSTHVAQALAHSLGVPAIAVQHHHAHIAVVHAEQAVDVPVIGLALDGVGLGSDGMAWGGEVLWVDGGLAAHRWSRQAHLAPLAMPGGDVAAREPWRMAASVLHAGGRGDEIESRYAPLVGALASRTLRRQMERQINCPATTSAGRWFDAAAGALGISVRQRVDAEAAIALEKLAREFLLAHPGFDVAWTSLDPSALVADLFELSTRGEAERQRGAARFHLGLASGLAHSAIDAARHRNVHTVVLGGGCFLNRVLRERLTTSLEIAGLRVLRPDTIPCGDAGLALGQAWIAACEVDARRAAQPSPRH
ncbi:MAG: carbamoyltransferase HypF [Betaproteobacteria bacterium]